MEDSATSSSSSNIVSSSHCPRSGTDTTAVENRIARAIRHPLHLLHRSESNFYVLRATANVYIVTLSVAPACTCPDRLTPCKHILFVLIRVLGIPCDDPVLMRRTLLPDLLHTLLSSPTLIDSLANPALRERFHQQHSETSILPSTSEGDDSFTIEEGTKCPVFLEELMAADEEVNENLSKVRDVVRCGTCKNAVHEECLLQWKRNSGRRSARCVLCRARWKELTKVTNRNHYLNLSAYLSGEEDDDCKGNDTTSRFIGDG